MGEQVDCKAVHHLYSRQLYAYVGTTVQLQVQSRYEKNLSDCAITNSDPFLTLRGRPAMEYVCSISCHVIARTAIAHPYPSVRDRCSRLTNQVKFKLASKHTMCRLCRLASTMTIKAKIAPPLLLMWSTTTTPGRFLPLTIIQFLLLLILLTLVPPILPPIKQLQVLCDY